MSDNNNPVLALIDEQALSCRQDQRFVIDVEADCSPRDQAQLQFVMPMPVDEAQDILPYFCRINGQREFILPMAGRFPLVLIDNNMILLHHNTP